jgi:hypothetical protein
MPNKRKPWRYEAQNFEYIFKVSALTDQPYLKQKKNRTGKIRGDSGETRRK